MAGWVAGAMGPARRHISDGVYVRFQTQLQLYRRARVVIFSEGSAVHALQLLGHLDCDVVILVRRPGNQLAAASLEPRVRSLPTTIPA